MCLVRRTGIQARLFLGAKCYGKGGHDSLRDPVLKREDICQRSVVSIRPDESAGGGIDELGVDAHPVTGPANATEEQVSHAELMRNVLHTHAATLVGERVRRDDVQTRGFREVRSQIL